MRIRLPFAIAFLLLLLLSAYLGLTPLQISSVNDKALHFITFFILTVTFYWILDASRRRILNTTLLSITLVFGVGSEVLQGLLPNDRAFDFYDIAANIAGSLLALGLCSWYHKRMLERKRRRKLEGYAVVGHGAEGGEDLELGEGQQLGVVDAHAEDAEGSEAWDEIGGNGGAEGEERMTSSSGSTGE